MSYLPISREELDLITKDIRFDILRMVRICGKQNGHLGGCMSAVELLTVLYTQVMNINYVSHSELKWSERDRFIMSKGHAGIAMYAAMKHVGLISQEMIEGSIRGDDSILFRHPKRNIEYGIECSVGSLGMGIGYGIGLAESFKRRKTSQRVFVMIGDGECDEGSVWEGAAYASHRKLDNLIVIIDMNGLQLDGPTHEVLSIDNMSERWRSFGFETVDVDGHDIDNIIKGFDTNHIERPLAIIAHTTKGKGIPFAENKTEWHDNYLSEELYKQGIKALGEEDLSVVRMKAEERYASKRINLDLTPSSYVTINESADDIEAWNDIGSKNIIGEISSLLAEQNEKFTLIYSDCANRIGIQKLQESHPEMCYEVGISEQNQVSMAAAMAHEGFHVFAVAYAPFITARVLDQIRANMAYMEAPVCLIGLGGGIASSDLGATHTAFEDIANLRSVPNVIVSTPVDTYEIAKNMEWFVNNPSPMYLRITINNPESKVYNHVIHDYTPLSHNVVLQGEDAVALVTGSLMSDVVEAVKLLNKNGHSVEVINVRSIKPLDKELINKVINAKKVITIEEHSIIGGLGSAIAEQIATTRCETVLKMIGINDEYFKADIPEAIRRKIGLNFESLAKTIGSFLEE